MSKLQHRGNCPCCGRQQAVKKSGLMSKHGYVVDHGWFNGVCNGEQYAPMQIQREVTDIIVKQVKVDVEILFEKAKNFKEGKTFPATIKTNQGKIVKGRREYEYIPFEQGSQYQKEEAIRGEIYNLESRARAGTIFAADMEELVNKVHGKPLIEVKVEQVAEPIKSGEQRKSARGVLTVRYVDGARVYWKDDRGIQSWTGSSAWRRMEAV